MHDSIFFLPSVIAAFNTTYSTIYIINDAFGLFTFCDFVFYVNNTKPNETINRFHVNILLDACIYDFFFTIKGGSSDKNRCLVFWCFLGKLSLLVFKWFLYKRVIINMVIACKFFFFFTLEIRAGRLF